MEGRRQTSNASSPTCCDQGRYGRKRLLGTETGYQASRSAKAADPRSETCGRTTLNHSAQGRIPFCPYHFQRRRSCGGCGVLPDSLVLLKTGNHVFSRLEARIYSLKGRFKCALKPVYESFGLEWQAPWDFSGESNSSIVRTCHGSRPSSLFALWRGPPPFNIDVFHDRRAQDEFVKEFVDGCKLRKVRLDRWCDCCSS